MDLKTYFEDTRGVGVLSTADREGSVDSAVYARPHVQEDGTLALIMRDRLSHKNLQSNPKAAYLFMEEGPGYQGKRFFLSKVREEEDEQKINSLKRRSYPQDEKINREARFLVYFTIDKELPLIGSGGK
ncbi:MAG: pyridoxamine 5'-phosphate oxidase family protein [Desulfohalobiaceae bacterium]|nr:pyridoxamine 5'-phosphate oxidase family protein [Desulfohalobiaceae bacterium]